MAEYKSIAEELEAMIAQTHEDSTVGNEGIDAGDDADNTVVEDNFEDTTIDNDGSDDDSDDEGEGNHDGDTGDGSDEDDDDTEGQDGNTQDGDNDTDSGSDGDNDSNDDNSDAQDDGSADKTDEVNYKEEYAKLKDFYDKVTSEFTASGKKIKGFKDPEKIVQGLQKAIGFEEKSAALKEYKKFLAPLKEKGFIDNEEKFNLALAIMDGDQEALKKHIKDLGINPIVDLDIDEINYSQKKYTKSEASLIIDETLEVAKQYGVDEKVRTVIGKEWDDASFNEFMKNPQVRDDLVTHMQDGTYDLVMERVQEIKATDFDDRFKGMKSTDQYRIALNSLVDEIAKEKAMEARKSIANTGMDGIPAKANIKEIDDRVTKSTTENAEAVKAKALKDAEADKARKAAASISQKKQPAKKVVVDPLEDLKGDDFRKYFNSLILGR